MKFPVNRAFNDESEYYKRRREDATKYLVARPGDWLFAPFQCELCWMKGYFLGRVSNVLTADLGLNNGFVVHKEVICSSDCSRKLVCTPCIVVLQFSEKSGITLPVRSLEESDCQVLRLTNGLSLFLLGSSTGFNCLRGVLFSKLVA